MTSDTTRERLLGATAEEVARHGIRGTSMRGVAERAGMRAASIFHHFPDGKDQLVREMLTHILDTIATRMTPTIQAGSALAPVDLVVQCAALFWDFLAEHPAYAGVLLREAFEPDETVAELIGERSAQVVALAVAYLEAGRAEGRLADVPMRRVLMHVSTYVVTFHAAPSMRRSILGEDGSLEAEREAFLVWVRSALV